MRNSAHARKTELGVRDSATPTSEMIRRARGPTKGAERWPRGDFSGAPRHGGDPDARSEGHATKRAVRPKRMADPGANAGAFVGNMPIPPRAPGARFTRGEYFEYFELEN